MESLNDRINFDLNNIDAIENVIIPRSKTLIYCHGWKANSGWFSNLFEDLSSGWLRTHLITRIS